MLSGCSIGRVARSIGSRSLASDISASRASGIRARRIHHKPPSETRVVVALSGGVDSAVSAYLLKEQGYQVSGVYMRNWSEADEQFCSGVDDLESVDKVAHFLNIPYRVVDFQKEYWNHVFEPVLDAYQAGVTPNPDVLCNREIKFKALSDFVFSRDPKPDFLATGHYAQIKRTPKSAPDASNSTTELEAAASTPNGTSPATAEQVPVKRGRGRPRKNSEALKPDHGYSVELVEAADHNKDQTYFLLQVPQQALQNVLFPIGHLTKPQVREIAIQANLPNAQRKESMGLCFVGKRKFDEFIGEFTERPGSKPGTIIDLDTSEMIGVHKGALFYTVGQAANISGAPGRYFVVGKDLALNTITVVLGSHHPALYKDTLISTSINWVSGLPPASMLSPGSSFKCFARIRHRQELQPCSISLLRQSTESSDFSSVKVTFDQPLRAISEGQFVGFYVDNTCLGGGVITSSGDSYHSLKKAVPIPEKSTSNRRVSRSANLTQAVDSL